MDIGNALWLFGICSEAVVVCLLVYRLVWRSLPIFTAYCVWDLANNAVLFPLYRYFATGYMTFYVAMTLIDTVLVFAVLIEVSWSILRPIRSSLPNRTPAIAGLAIIAIGAAIWPLSGIHRLASLSTEGFLLAHLQQTISILRIFFFLALAGCSQLLSIGWRDRELQVATGLGFYSLVSLGAAMLRSHETSVLEYRHLNQFVVASYLCSLLYWVYSFAQQEAERREFTPQMQNFLLAAAGVAREQRLALVQASMERHRQNS